MNGYKKICIITAARSEYGLLRWIIDVISHDNYLRLQLVVTGSHLSVEQGMTYRQIEQDGYHIDEKIEMLLSSGSSVGIAKSMGICAMGISACFQRLQPDIIVVLGDRYELLPICSTALVMGIPIAHISGGDVTEGALDNEVRNAVTMMSSLHFPGVQDSADRIKQMRNTSANIYTVGEPGLENFVRYQLLSRDKLAVELHLKLNSKWILLAYHPETRLTVTDNLNVAQRIIESLLVQGNIQVIISKSNADLGGVELNTYWGTVVAKYPQRFSLFSSLGQLRYLSYMKEAYFVIGNSSSGIVEAPFLGVPVINIGNRQKGRYLCKNVLSSDGSSASISTAINQVDILNRSEIMDTYYGDGNSSMKIVNLIKEFLNVAI